MDLKNVDWPATLKLIVLRLVAAGLIAGVIMFIAKPSGQSLLAIVVGPLAVGIMVGFALICSVLVDSEVRGSGLARLLELQQSLVIRFFISLRKNIQIFCRLQNLT